RKTDGRRREQRQSEAGRAGKAGASGKGAPHGAPQGGGFSLHVRSSPNSHTGTGLPPMAFYRLSLTVSRSPCKQSADSSSTAPPPAASRFGWRARRGRLREPPRAGQTKPRAALTLS